MVWSVNHQPPKKAEAWKERECARLARSEARIKQREEEAMDRKADKAEEHGNQLRRDHANILDRIQGYHRHIDGCTAEMTECERRTDESLVTSQQELIRTKRAEAITFGQLGTCERELGNRSQAEAKQREAMRRERVPFQPMRRFLKQPF